jgi:membrane protease YdiL (CAAX protease family)
VTITRPALLTRADGRERIGIPFWNGVLAAIGSTIIGFAATFVATFVLVVAVVLATGRAPLMTPGHPVLALAEIIFYATGGAFAWYRLRATGRTFFRPLDARDVRILLLGVAALFAVRVGTVIQLIVSNQTKHVQAGFEHFSVNAHAPAVTALSVALAVITIVVIAPIIEEIVFRGLLFGALAPRLGVLAAAIVSALLFGLIHGDPVLFPTLAALGFVAALSYAATGNLVVPIALHALNNALGAAALIATSLQHR